MHLVITLAALALLGSSQEGQEGSVAPGGERTAWYDLRPIASWCPQVFGEVDMRVHAATIWVPDPWFGGSPAGADAAVGLDELMGRLADSLGLTGAEQRTRLAPIQGRLRFLGSDAEHAALRDTLAMMEAVALDGALVEIFRVGGGEDLPPVMGASEFEDFVTSGRARLLHAARTPMGRTTVIGGETHRAHHGQLQMDRNRERVYLQGVVGLATSGSRIGFRVDRATEGDGVLVRAWGRDGDVDGPMRRVPLEPYDGHELTLLAQAGPVPTHVEEVPTSIPWTIGAESHALFVSDFWLEASSDGFFADPWIQCAPSGLKVGLRLDRAVDGERWALRAWVSSGDIERPMGSILIKGIGGNTLQLPSARSAVGGFSGLVPPGGALLAQILPEECLLMRLPRARAAALTQGPDPAQLPVPLGEFVAPPMRMTPIDIPYAHWTLLRYPWEEFSEELMPQTAPWASDPVSPVTFARQTLGLEDAELRYFAAGSALAPAHPAARRALERALAEYGEGLAPGTSELEFAYGLIPARTATFPVGEPECAALAGALPGRVQAPCLDGDALALVGVTERSYLQGHDISVGNGVSTNNPAVATVAQGLSLWIQPVAVTGGGLRLSLQAIYHAPHGEFERGVLPALLPGGGPGARKLPLVTLPYQTYVELPIELPTSRRASYRGAATYTPDRWHAVTVQDLGDGENTFALLIRVRLR